jgi:deazaflavin-dependent oxidoreductase (nitroreductase family)
MPRWLAHVNKRVFNPLAMRRSGQPVLVHEGRVSGKTYRTPMDAHPIPDGYVFIPMYGPRTDWLRNVLATGTAHLAIGGKEFDLVSPRLVRKQDIWSLLPPTTKVPPTISDESELLRMDIHQ